VQRAPSGERKKGGSLTKHGGKLEGVKKGKLRAQGAGDLVIESNRSRRGRSAHAIEKRQKSIGSGL